MVEKRQNFEPFDSDKGNPPLAGRDVNIHPGSKLGSHTTIGYGTNITGLAFIASRKDAPVTIGKYCAIGHGLRIRAANHFTGYANLQAKFQKWYGFPPLGVTKGFVEIGNNVWIGDNVVILSGVTIGDGAVIGAGAIVTENIPSFSIAAGNPARVMKQRFSKDVIEQLKTIDWWNWPEEKIRRNRRFFETDFTKDRFVDIHQLIID